MFRWSGSKELAEQQSSERQQRSARRYIRSLPTLDTSVDEFHDCDEAGQVANLDGNDSGGEGDPDPSVMAPPIPFDQQNAADDENAWKKTVDIVFQTSSGLRS